MGQTNAFAFSSFCDLFTAEEWQGFRYFEGIPSTCLSHPNLLTPSYAKTLGSGIRTVQETQPQPREA